MWAGVIVGTLVGIFSLIGCILICAAERIRRLRDSEQKKTDPVKPDDPHDEDDDDSDDEPAEENPSEEHANKKRRM